MENYNRLILFYTYFYQKVFSNPNFEYREVEKEVIIIWKFAEYLEKNISLGEEWLFKYMTFQFEYWSSKKFKKIKTIVVSYVFGGKALGRFINRNEESDYFIDEFIRNYKLSINDIIKNKYYKQDLLELSNVEEVEKQKYIEGFDRLLNCIEKTTLFNIKSQICIFCLKSKVCKDIQKKKYPKIYKERNEKSFKEISREIEKEKSSV